MAELALMDRPVSTERQLLRRKLDLCVQLNDAWVLSHKDQLSFNRVVFVGTRDLKAPVIGRERHETIRQIWCR